MKSKHAAKNLDEAINLFLHELPDPVRSNVSTVTDSFSIKGKDVVLSAQKAKGNTGMTWRIDSSNN